MKQLSPGQTFDCQYVIRRELGSGKHKIAYLARSLNPYRIHSPRRVWHQNSWFYSKLTGFIDGKNNNVVVKVMDGPADSCAEINRMIHLAHHPNITKSYFGTSESETPYFVEECLNGKSLEVLSNEGFNKTSSMRQVASALEESHMADIVHNDLHPGNIFLCGRRVKVTDFGNSLVLGKTHPADHCKTKYRAPETFDGEPVPASDVWSLGVIMYEQFAGVRPFEQDHPNMPSEEYQNHMRDKILHDDPVWLRDRTLSVKPRMEELVHAMLNKNPYERPTAKDVHRALRWRIF